MEELLRFIGTANPNMVGLSCSVYFNFPHLIQTIEAIQKEFAHITIAVGGRALVHGGLERVKCYPDTRCIHSMAELEDMLQLW